MAVVQISRIQVRRGKANNGTGFPQLASGEMGWAIDTQELYIGNGSVAEGSPAVGNTKVITLNDFTAQGSILNLIQHIYRPDQPILTGATVANPVSRPIQDRLDDRVTVSDFITSNDKLNDDYTVALQRAINQLFLNDQIGKASDINSESNRVRLEMTAGVYTISNTIYIPSYASLVGAGLDKTIIRHTGSGPAFVFVNDASNIGAPSTLVNTESNTRPKNINISNLTISTSSTSSSALILNAVQDSIFENLIIEGNWGNAYNSNSRGITMNAKSALVTCENNLFKNITIRGFSYAVYSKQDILNNTFADCYINNVRQGFVLGGYQTSDPADNIEAPSNGSTIGEQYGPRDNHFTNCKFEDVMRNAVYIHRGTGNTVRDCTLINVGNNNGTHNDAAYPQIYFNIYGNTVENNMSDRFNLEVTTQYPITTPYLPVVAGHAVHSLYGSRQLQLGQQTSPSFVFRLPVSTTQFGIPVNSVTYNIDYVYQSTQNNFSRQGTISISVQIGNPTNDIYFPKTQLSDEYNFAGDDTNGTKSLRLDFSVVLYNENGTVYTGAQYEVPTSVHVYYTNTLANDAGYLNYTYTVLQ